MMSGSGWIVRASAVGAVLVALALLVFRAPGLAADAADGSYVNDCCGTVLLDGGRMVLGGTKTVEYELERDEAGPYLLPKTYVGTWEDRGFEVDGSRAPMKLRVDALPRPSRIDIPAARGWHRFDRKAPRRIRIGS